MSQSVSHTAHTLQLNLGMLTHTSAAAPMVPRTPPADRFVPCNVSRFDVAPGPNALQSQLLARHNPTPAAAAPSGTRLFHPLQLRTPVAPARPTSHALATLRLNALPVGIR